MPEYREIAPAEALTGFVESFWLSNQLVNESPQRVTPDGCADILFSADGDSAALEVVGPMTRYKDFPMGSPRFYAGVRFRPGMSRHAIRIGMAELTDRSIPLEAFWGAGARQLLTRLRSEPNPERRIALLAASLSPVPRRNPVQRAIAFMERRHGVVSIGGLAQDCGLSERQFRRLCIEESGLTPKFLARTLRFRHALAKARVESGKHAGLAAECGFTDQAHLIAEFRSFSGRTPGEYACLKL